MGKLGHNTSSAHDTMNAMIIKLGIQTLHKPLVHIINLSIGQGKFACQMESWKVTTTAQGKRSKCPRSNIIETHLSTTNSRKTGRESHPTTSHGIHVKLRATKPKSSQLQKSALNCNCYAADK